MSTRIDIGATTNAHQRRARVRKCPPGKAHDQHAHEQKLTAHQLSTGLHLGAQSSICACARLHCFTDIGLAHQQLAIAHERLRYSAQRARADNGITKRPKSGKMSVFTGIEQTLMPIHTLALRRLLVATLAD